MNPEPKELGHTTPVPINLLESAEFDFFDGTPRPTRLGKTEAPLNLLSAWALDAAEKAVPTPALILTFQLRTTTNTAAATLDLFTVFAVLNRYEISLGGAGLLPNETKSDLTASNGTLRLALTPTDAGGAIERLRKLAAAVNQPDTVLRRDTLANRSFEQCRAEVQAAV